MCEYECYRIGGPWIAENPNCPIHGRTSNGREDRLYGILEKVAEKELGVLEAISIIEEEFS